jgi:hypothetical protein
VERAWLTTPSVFFGLYLSLLSGLAADKKLMRLSLSEAKPAPWARQELRGEAWSCASALINLNHQNWSAWILAKMPESKPEG